MNALLILLILLILALLGVNGRTGLSTLFGLALNLCVIFGFLLTVSWRLNILVCLIFTSLIILFISVYLSSDNEQVTRVAFKASLIATAGLFILAILVQFLGQFQGFDIADTEALEELSLSVGLNFGDIAIAVMVLSTLGAIAEAAMAITEDLSELIEQHTRLSQPELNTHRQVVSQQILGTAINTLFFGMLGSSAALILWMLRLHYSLAAFWNSKLLIMAIVTMLLGMLGIILVIWLAGQIILRNYGKIDA